MLRWYTAKELFETKFCLLCDDEVADHYTSESGEQFCRHCPCDLLVAEGID